MPRSESSSRLCIDTLDGLASLDRLYCKLINIMGERKRAYGACLTCWDSCLDTFWPSLLIYGEQMKVLDKQWVMIL